MDEQAFELLTDRLDTIEKNIEAVRYEVHKLVEFRGKILGVTSLASFLGATVITLIFKFLG